jgi:6-phosphogluconolactonase
MTVEDALQTGVRSTLTLGGSHPAPSGQASGQATEPHLRLEVRSNPAEAARASAGWIAGRLAQVADERSDGKPITLGVSGGRTPAAMLVELGRHRVPWDRLHVFQVDERVVSATDERRNAHQLTHALAARLDDRLHLLNPQLDDPDEAARSGTESLDEVLGPSGGLDVVHLGIGDDGHTASLVPGDTALQVERRGYTTTDPYQGTRRITLTYSTLGVSKWVCWLATGASKGPMISRLLRCDPAIPAGRLGRLPGVVFTDVPTDGPR